MNKSREYELFTKRLCMTLTRIYPNVEVEHDQVIGGNQIDVSWTHRLAGVEYLTIVECKNYNASVDLNCFRQLAYNMDCLRARGVLVTTVGFQSGVIEAAKSRGDVTLLKVKFEVEKKGATLDFVIPRVANVQYIFDQYTSTQWQLDMLHDLFQNGQAGQLIVFCNSHDETFKLENLHSHLPTDVQEGVHTIPLDGFYVRLPAPYTVAIRIAYATYAVEKTNFSRQFGMTLTADIVTANVVNQLTGEKYTQVIDDDFLS